MALTDGAPGDSLTGMAIEFEEFVRRVESVKARMAEACRAAGRDPREVKLLPVTKTLGPWAAEYAARLGLPAVGENRVQEAAAKRTECGGALRWELIGHLQSNKAKLAVETFDRVQSVDSAKLAGLLDRAAGEQKRILPILIQVNAGRDDAKFGASLEEAPRLLEQALGLANLKVEGLMTIAPLADDPEVARRTFAALRSLRDELQGRLGKPLPELSMGMTGDLDAAVAEGATMVRVGTAIYGERTNG